MISEMISGYFWSQCGIPFAIEDSQVPFEDSQFVFEQILMEVKGK